MGGDVRAVSGGVAPVLAAPNYATRWHGAGSGLCLTVPGSGGSEATTGPLTGQIATTGQIHTEQESRKLVLQYINTRLKSSDSSSKGTLPQLSLVLWGIAAWIFCKFFFCKIFFMIFLLKYFFQKYRLKNIFFKNMFFTYEESPRGVSSGFWSCLALLSRSSPIGKINGQNLRFHKFGSVP